MNGFHAFCLGMSSQFPTKTSRKKTANVMVGNSMRSPAIQSRERDDHSPAGVRARARDDARARGDIAYHDAVSAPPVFTQNTLREGFVEFAFGEPDPALLPVGLVREAAARALGAGGAAALAYGSNPGPEALRAAVAERAAAREGLALSADDVLVSGGNSQALGQVLTLLTDPGDVVFVECPTYNLALGIIADHPVDVVGVPLDAEGLDVDALDAAVRDVRASGRRPRLLYTIPTYHNPAGVSLSAPRRLRLLELARREDLVLVEDDVYRELAYDGRGAAVAARAGPGGARRPAGLLLQVAGAGAQAGLDRRAVRPARAAVGRRRARERRLREPVLGAPGGRTARGRRVRRPRDHAAPRLRLAPRRAGGRAPRAPAGGLRVRPAGRRVLPLGHLAAGSDGVRPAAGGRAPRRRVRPRTPVPHRWRRPQPAALLQPLRRGEPRRGRAAARRRRRRGQRAAAHDRLPRSGAPAPARARPDLAARPAPAHRRRRLPRRRRGARRHGQRPRPLVPQHRLRHRRPTSAWSRPWPKTRRSARP